MTARTLQLPGLDADAGIWQRRTRFDRAACALADRHYARGVVGADRIGAPGRTLCFVTPCERAVWLTHWPLVTLDGLDSWRCALFRNEGAGLSSALIVAAMEATARLWTARPADGWLTFVDTNQTRSPHAGYCFVRAGWTRDRDWQPDRRRPHYIRLRAPAPADTPTPTPPHPLPPARRPSARARARAAR